MWKLLVLINQSFCDYVIDTKQMSNTLFTNFSTELKKQIGICKNTVLKCNKLLSQIMWRADNDTFKFYFQRKSRFR